MLLDFRNDLHIVANITISHEANDADMILRGRWIKRCFDGFHHLSSTITGTLSEKFLRLGQIFWSRRHWLRKEYACITGKCDQVKSISWIQIVESKLHGLF